MPAFTFRSKISALRFKDFKLPSTTQPFKPQLPVGKGFTLIELLIVIALIGILATVILANYNSFGARQEVKNAAEELKSELRKYQTFAISGQKNPTQSVGCLSSTLDSYSIIIDSTPHINVDLNCTDPNSVVPITNEFPWPSTSQVTVSEVGIYNASVPSFTSCASVNIVFRPTNQGVTLECSGVPTTEDIYLRVVSPTASGLIYNLIVTSAGEIYVQKQ
ncbi:MAG: prepilin-type N-terminal cleavage/methylation domain-containing protein [Candidatus Woykebacteria bacterium]